MVSVNQKIWNLISKELCIRRELIHGLINVRALAKYLIDKYSLNVSLDSAISAIRRYESSEVCELPDNQIINLFKDCVVTTRSNVASLTVRKNGGQHLSKILNLKFKDLNLVCGNNDIKIICDIGDLGQVKNLFEGEKVKCETGLSVLGVNLSDEAIKTKGVLARIANEISIQGVNISEIVICPPEFLILIKEEDMLNTHTAVMNIKLGKI